MPKKGPRSKKASAPKIKRHAPPADNDAAPPTLAIAEELPPPPPALPPPLREEEVPVYEIDVEKHFASPSLSEAQELVRAQAERRATERASPPVASPRVSSPLLASAVAAWIVVAGLLLLQPPIARGPADQPWAPPPQNIEASLRYGLWLAQGRVEHFLRTRGRMPSFLAEAGIDDLTLTLVVVRGTEYRLEGRAGELVLELSSEMSADSMLGASRAQLQGR